MDVILLKNKSFEDVYSISFCANVQCIPCTDTRWEFSLFYLYMRSAINTLEYISMTSFEWKGFFKKQNKTEKNVDRHVYDGYWDIDIHAAHAIVHDTPSWKCIFFDDMLCKRRHVYIFIYLVMTSSKCSFPCSMTISIFIQLEKVCKHRGSSCCRCCCAT